jgi:glycosyltransferase A (GT-A) superfamily protein (DUF2064 family)
VVVIGADSPTLPIEAVRQAFDHLRDEEVVLAPTDDGGYWLVGVRASAPKQMPSIFDRLDWGTERVWSQTVERLQTSSTTWRELPRWYDVDELADLERLRAELHGPLSDDPAFDALRTALGAGLPTPPTP